MQEKGPTFPKFTCWELGRSTGDTQAGFVDDQCHSASRGQELPQHPTKSKETILLPLTLYYEQWILRIYIYIQSLHIYAIEIVIYINIESFLDYF